MSVDWIIAAKAAVLGLVQGITEFLPISSTGHLIIANGWLGTEGENWKAFDVFIHLGTILAVCWVFRLRLLRSVGGLAGGDKAAWRFWILLFIAFLPVAVVGLMTSHAIKTYLFSPAYGPWTVMTMLVLGALVIFWVEHWYRGRQKRGEAAVAGTVEAVTPKQALLVGLAQVLSLIPGTSRSGSTIIGGMIFGLSRQAATEFTFFLAIPTMFVATGYDLYQSRDFLSVRDAVPFAVGFVVAFASALLVVRWLLRYVANHDFRGFAWYRIGLGIAILLYVLLRRG